MSNVKTAPGIVRMACRIWEPQPIKMRASQEESFVYNQETLNYFGNIPNSQPISYIEDSMYLREKYVYYDTFLRNSSGLVTSQQGTTDDIATTGEPVGYGNDSLNGFQGELLFNTDYSPTPGHPWIYHQSFVMNQSLFPLGQTSNALWALTTTSVPYVTPKPDDNSKASDFDPTVPSGVDNYNQRVGYANWRKSNRFFPMQTATGAPDLQYFDPNEDSSNSSSPPDPSTISATTALPVHWLAIKETRMFNAEDFFVEFKRGAFFTDINVNDTNLQDTYQELDSTLVTLTEDVSVGSATISAYRNYGVLGSLDPQGTPNADAQSKLNLARQPYYCIEINHGHTTDNYWIIIPYNGNPVFIRRGKFPVQVPGVTDPTDPQSTIPPSIQQLSNPVSTLIDTYEISSKKLMDAESLRVTVRNHLGNLVIIFSGYEDNPWIIRGKEWDIASYQNDSTVLGQNPIKLRVYPYPIQVGAGNLLCGFMFGALTYETTAVIASPETLLIRGPVQQTDLNLYLRDKQTRVINGKTINTYSQEAEVYIEVENGVATIQPRINTIDLNDEIWRVVGLDLSDLLTPPPAPNHPRPYTNVATQSYPTDSYGKISYLKVDADELVLPPIPQGATPPPPTPYDQFKFKHCTVRYTLGAGDMTLYADDNNRSWNLQNCITSIGNGWRVYVAPSSGSQSVCPIEAAQHVTNFSCSSSYTDDIKVERSGSIKFIMNFGTMTGVQWKDDTTDATNANSNSNCNPYDIGDPDSYLTDYTTILSNLSGKTFFIRIYVWWDGGFMACANNTCDCGNATTPTATGADPRIVFTGLCHGGQITVENGKRYMECQLLDYWEILKDMKFLNSPFFDGMRDFNAVNEILQMAGFAATPDNSGSRPPDNYPPALFIQNCADTNKDTFVISSYGEPWPQQDFGLGSAYELLQSPIFKFADGSGYDEAIIDIAGKASSMVYFDRYGEFKMVSRSDIRLCTMGSQAVKCNFFATPLQDVGTGCTRYNVLALTNYSYCKKVSDSFNEINLVSATPDGAKIQYGSISYAGRFDPTTDGYIGYTKRFTQHDGSAGSLTALVNRTNYYASFYTPPITISWESFGVSHLSAGDLVTFTGLQLDNTFPTGSLDVSLPMHTMTVYLTSVSMEIDPSRNEWKNKYEGEWIYINQTALQGMGYQCATS